jgi:hypothetical protein
MDHILPSSLITFESVPNPLAIDCCHVFEKQEGLCSYDALLRTYTNNLLLKVVADYDSPISLHELDQVVDKFPDLSPERANSWKLVFIIPSSMQSRFTKQPCLGVGKYRWDTGFLDQGITCI